MGDQLVVEPPRSDGVDGVVGDVWKLDSEPTA